MKKSRPLAGVPLALTLFASTAIAQTTTGTANPGGTMSNSTNASACETLPDAQQRANCLTTHQNGPNTTIGAQSAPGGAMGVPNDSRGPSTSSPRGLNGGEVGSGTDGSAAGGASGGGAAGGGSGR